MKKIYSFILTLCFVIGTTVIVAAQEAPKTTPGVHTPGIHTRQKIQRKRITHGVRNKSLTKGETASVLKGQKEIHQDKVEARSDGTVTGAERKEIHQEQNQASRKIYNKKHNSRTRN